jgi:hypothetical protein
MELAGETQGGQDFVINLQPRFYGFCTWPLQLLQLPCALLRKSLLSLITDDNVAQFESSYTEEQVIKLLIFNQL